MSRQSLGAHLLGPNLPVRAYSEALEAEYLNMHRDLCILVEVPSTLDSAACLCEHLRKAFTLPENCWSKILVFQPPWPAPSPTRFATNSSLTARAWATTDKGWALYEEWYGEEQKSFDTHGTRYQDFVNPENFWHRLRTTAFSTSVRFASFRAE